MKLSRITRLLEMIGLLQAGPGRNARSLSQECHVSRRTIFRDLEVLRQAGVPLVYDPDGQRYFIPGTYFLPPTNFTPEEALALLVLCYELGNSAGVPFQDAARTAAIKLESSLPSRLREHIRGATDAVRVRLEPTNRLSDKRSTYDLLLAAIARRQYVRIHYRSFAERELIGTKLSPFRLLFSRRSWYAIGRSSLHRGVRTFNVGRIESAELLDETFRIPRGFSVERFLRNAWHLIPEPGPDQKVVVRFEKLVAGNVAEVNWHKTQHLVWLADGRMDFHAHVSGIGEISWWILGYGDQAEVIEPPALRELVADRARRLVARYSPATNGRAKRVAVAVSRRTGRRSKAT